MQFVKIETLFTEQSMRTSSQLSALYDNKTLLKKKICAVGKGVIDNPDVIRNKKILLKPNWVTHDRKEGDEICLRTNDNFLIATIEIILENKPASIIIGDAPIQSCDWEKLLNHQLLKTLNHLSVSHSIPIIVKDFRRVTFHPFKNNPNKDRNPLSEYLIFDLGKASHLDPISSTQPLFRVTNYDPDRLAEAHTLGKHQYCITKELFNADVIISIPKIKTHQKTGITGALKNIVGLNGDKDYLPHHRIGGDKVGGDCYPGKNILRLSAEKMLDKSNRNQGKMIYWLWYWNASILWKLSWPKKVHQLAAGWYGNDTCWRMVMDVNKVAIYGKKDGSLSDKPQRQVYSLCDGIIGGQGDGPLNPFPLALGIVSFSNDSSLNDICMSSLMGLEPRKVPLINYAILKIQNQENEIILNENKVDLSELQTISIPTTLPPGWLNYLNEL